MCRSTDETSAPGSAFKNLDTRITPYTTQTRGPGAVCVASTIIILGYMAKNLNQTGRTLHPNGL